MGIYPDKKIRAIQFCRPPPAGTGQYELVKEIDTDDWTPEEFIERYEEELNKLDLPDDYMICTKHDTWTSYDPSDNSTFPMWFPNKELKNKQYGLIL